MVSAVEDPSRFPAVEASYHFMDVPVVVKFAIVGESPEQNIWDAEPVGAAGLMVILPLVPDLEDDEVAVKVPVSALPVYLIPNVVRSATPVVKSPEAVSLLVPVSPVTFPVKGELAAMVTLSVEALKVVIVFPYASWAVRVFVPVKGVPLL